MPRRKKQAGEPINLDEITDVSEAQKVTFTEMGYKPYITDSGKIKWLTDDQYLYKKIKHNATSGLFHSHKLYKGPRRLRTPFKVFYRVLMENWIITLLLFGVLVLLLYINPIITFLNKLF